MGGGTSERGTTNKRRRNETEYNSDGNDNVDDHLDGVEESETYQQRPTGKARRTENIGSKKVKKEFYKVAKDKARSITDKRQWTR